MEKDIDKYVFWDILNISLQMEVFVQTTVVKWGNSHGIRLPKAFLKSINIAENDYVDITLDNKKIIIRKIEEKKIKKLEQRLLEFYGENFDKIVDPQKEYDWGKPVGKEEW